MDFCRGGQKGIADLDNRALTEALDKLWRRHCRQLRILIGLVRAYQLVISPLLGPRCRFQPTCSHAIEALSRFGMIKGSWLALKRVLKCHPLNPVAMIRCRQNRR